MVENEIQRRLDEVNDEIRELEESIGATRTHGFLYYGLLVVIIFLGFALGYATRTLYGVIFILAGLALVAYREMGHYRDRVAAIDTLIHEKRHEKQAIEQRIAADGRHE